MQTGPLTMYVSGGGTPSGPPFVPPGPGTSNIPVIASAGTQNQTGTSTAPTGTKSTLAIPDDYAFWWIRWDGSTGATLSAGTSGATKLGTTMQDPVSLRTWELWYRVLTDADVPKTNHAFALSASVAWTIHGFFAKNANPIVAPIVGAANASAIDDTAPIALSLTTVTANSLVVGFFGATAAITYTAPAGMTELTDNSANEIAMVVQAAAGASGNKTATASGATAWVGMLVAIAPSVGIRLYMDPTVDAVGRPTPGFSSAWEQSSGVTERTFRYIKGADAAGVDFPMSESSAATNYDVAILRCWIRLGAGTITGAFRGQMRCFRDAGDLVISNVTIQVYTVAGAAVGTAFAGTSNTAAANGWVLTTPTNNHFTKVNDLHDLTPVVVANGDWLAVTLGYRVVVGVDPTATIRTLRARITADFLENDTTTTDSGSWFQFTRQLPGY